MWHLLYKILQLYPNFCDIENKSNIHFGVTGAAVAVSSVNVLRHVPNGKGWLIQIKLQFN